MNYNKLEVLLSPAVLLVVNGLIILTTELTHQLFFKFGVIHIIAVLFVMLSVIRIFLRHYTYDPILEKFFRASLIALFVFSLSHIVEYLNMSIASLQYHSDSVLINTVNFYLISLVLIIVGAEAFLRIHDGRSARMIKTLMTLIVFLVALILIFMTKRNLVSLELNEPLPYIYMGAVILLGTLAMEKIARIGKHVKFSNDFVNYFSASIVLLVLATVPYIFYEWLENAFNTPIYQIMYLAHFFFYASSSLMFLAFGRVNVSGGVYDDLKKISNEKTPA